MKLRHRSLVVLCVTGLLASGALVSTAVAAPEPIASELSSQAAQAHYDAGQTYFEQGDLQRALVEFRAAQRDDDRPALDYNIGLCLERLGDAARAVEAYQRYRTRAGAAGAEAELGARIAILEGRIGELEVVTRLAGVHVTLDDAPVVLAPGGVLRLTEGGHRLIGAKEGHLSRSVEVSVVAGRRVHVELDPVLPAGATQGKRRALAIGLGVGGGVVLVGIAVGLGVFYGTRAPVAPYEGNIPSIIVNP